MENKKEVSSSKINDGKCCRCMYRKMKKCSCKDSKMYDQFVPKKHGCKFHKYRD